MGMVKQSIQHCRDQCLIAAKYISPLTKRQIGGNDDRAGFIALGDYLKEQVGLNATSYFGMYFSQVNVSNFWGSVQTRFDSRRSEEHTSELQSRGQIV